ncbi:two-component system sensor histidine kinase MtrB [Phycicoccus badiiscoriae]|uniref:Sensor histidine kinase MtrB n=1 Tax=Pedococcus badiiscoriae TaxID=642776 RepID=A0A852WN89_9MICO|nr:MtrAB system histidine kinase MtrB [Pedococcus badiiscoriae]NYG07695.1 two-component system sensor histidine kinase MtrB [Pedococcus badiiscoriae]
MSESARPRPGRTPAPRFSDHRAQAMRALRVLAGRSRRRLVRWMRTVVHLWRVSLQFRVVTSTMLLGLAVVALLGSYLFSSISDGLEQDRIESAKLEASRLTAEVQGSFDNSDRTSSEADLNLLARQAVQSAASPGGDNERYLVLTRSLANTSNTSVQTISSGRVGLPVVPMALREAVRADSRRQQVMLVGITDPQSGGRVPAVIVGSQVVVPLAGSYDLYAVFPMQREQATLDLITRTFLIGGLALVFLVGAIAWVVTRQVVSPVRRAAVVAERLSSGRLNERMRARGEDDLARLAKSFNEMADSLQTQIRQLEGLSRVQQRFVSDVSHELRTPLTTIRMAADLIHDSRTGFDPAVSRSAELLHNELDRFEELLADLLEISRFDAGAAALDAEVTDLRTTVERAVHSAQPIADRWGSAVTVTADGPCEAEVDVRRVERILRNLVVNALEHGEGRPVDIAVAVNETAAAITVRDHGVGLRPGEGALVFNRFWRADPARARTTGGTGLGLAISLEDARLHDGWLQAWGEPGEGSCFRLTLPRQAGTPIVEAPLPLRPDDVPEPPSAAVRTSPGPLGQSSVLPHVVTTRHTPTAPGTPR